jgi:hypothetical protein
MNIGLIIVLYIFSLVLLVSPMTLLFRSEHNNTGSQLPS